MTDETMLEGVGISRKDRTIRFLRKNIVLIALILVIAIFGFTAPNFFTLQNLLNIGGTIPDVTIMIDRRTFSDRGTGQPWMESIFPSGFAKVQQILSRNVIIIAVAYPI